MTFTVLAKINSTKCFVLIIKVAGLGKFFFHKNFYLYGVMPGYAYMHRKSLFF